MTVHVIEIRNYRLKPGVRDAFIDYFEAHFIASQEALGMAVLGQFRVISAPDRFVWLRGFRDMESRLEGLQAFYGGAVWAKYGPRANDMMLEWDNVHLLQTVSTPDLLMCDFTAERITAELEAGTISPYTGVIGIDFYQRQGVPFGVLNAQVEECYRQAAIQDRCYLIAKMDENHFTRLPVIQDPNELVAITSYSDEEYCRGQRDHLPLPADGILRESLLLLPTLRSPLRDVPLWLP